MNEYVPVWACRQWGGYEHDWMDCDECVEGYENWIYDQEMLCDVNDNPLREHLGVDDDY